MHLGGKVPKPFFDHGGPGCGITSDDYPLDGETLTHAGSPGALLSELCRPLAFAESECLSWLQLFREKQQLERKDVHVWLAWIDESASNIERYIKFLPPHEVAQAERFQGVPNRHRYIVTRGLLRAILSRYLQTKPECLRFFSNEHGKPFLAFPGGAQAVNFNLSHSSELALFAITHQERRIGVDLERIRTIVSVDQIAEKFFSSAECAAFEIMPEPLKSQSFLRSWTRMEAYIKALGMDLTAASKDNRIPLPGKIPGQEREHMEEFPWSINCWEPAPEYVAAVVVEGSDWRLTYWELGE